MHQASRTASEHKKNVYHNSFLGRQASGNPSPGAQALMFVRFVASLTDSDKFDELVFLGVLETVDVAVKREPDEEVQDKAKVEVKVEVKREVKEEAGSQRHIKDEVKQEGKEDVNSFDNTTTTTYALQTGADTGMTILLFLIAATDLISQP